MLSRTADHLYWMARYMERADRVRSTRGEATTPAGASAHAGFSA
jgi:A predicted alpha-helical domain with a conserved ER motif.